MKLLRKLPKRTLAVVLSIVLVVVSLPLVARERGQAIDQPLNTAMVRALAHALSEPDPDSPGQRRILPEIEAMTWSFPRQPGTPGSNAHGAWGREPSGGAIAAVNTTVFANNAPNAMWEVIERYHAIMRHSHDRTIVEVTHGETMVIGSFVFPASMNAMIRDYIFRLYPELEVSDALFDLLGQAHVGEGSITYDTFQWASGGTPLHGARGRPGRLGSPYSNFDEMDCGGALFGGVSNNNMHTDSVTWNNPSHADRHRIYGEATAVGRVTRTQLEMFRSFDSIDDIPNAGYLTREMRTHLHSFMTRISSGFLGIGIAQFVWLVNGHRPHGLRVGSGDNQVDANHIRWGAHHAAAWAHAQYHGFMVHDLNPVDTVPAREVMIDYRAAISRDGQLGSWVDYEYLRVLSRTELLQRQVALSTALNALPVVFAQEGGIAAPVLEHFGLPTLQFGQETLDIISQLLAVFLNTAVDHASWFFSPATAPAPGVVFHDQAPGARHVFDSVAQTHMDNPGYDLREDFINRGFTLAELQSLYREAAFRRDRLLAIYNDVTVDWDNLVFAASFLIEHAFVLDIDRAVAWMTRLNSVIQRWEIWDMRDAMVALIDASANYSEGRNPNLGEYPFEGDYFGDSDYANSFSVIVAWRDTIIGQQGFLDTKGVMGYASYVEAIVGFDYQVNTVAYFHHNRLLDLAAEIAYRETHYFSEARWYSFRDFFLPLMAESPFAHRSPQWLMSTLNGSEMRLIGGNWVEVPFPHPNAPRPSYRGVRQNIQAYISMANEAYAYFGNRDPGGEWYSIFGGGFYEQIRLMELQMQEAIAVNLAMHAQEAMSIIYELKDAGVDPTRIDALEVFHPRYDYINVLSWNTMDQLLTIVRRMGFVEGTHDAPNWTRYSDPFYFLQHVIGDLSQIELPGYPNLIARADIIFLRGIEAQYRIFLQNPQNHHRRANLPAPQRAATPRTAGQSNPFMDIRDNHDYNINSGDPGKEGLEHLIYGLDALLTGNLAPFVQAMGALGIDLPSDALELLPGMELDLGAMLGADPLNVGSILQDAISAVLFSDATVNMIVQMLYDLLLGEFEYIWANEVQRLSGRGRVRLGVIRELGMSITVTGLNLQMFPLWDVLNSNVYVGTALRMNGLPSLRLYPDLLARAIDPGMFPEARNMLLGVGTPYASTLGSGTNNQNAVSRFRVDMNDRQAYPTNAWNRYGSPHMFDADGNMLLYWGINGDPIRFRQALSQALSGVLPLLQTLLFDRHAYLHANGWALTVAGGSARVSTGIGISIGGVGLSGHGVLSLRFSGPRRQGNAYVGGLDLYRNLLVPIFEILLGEDLTGSGLIMNTNDTGVFGTTVGMPAGQTSLSRGDLTSATRQIVDGILYPVDELLRRIGEAPIATVVDLLPNLAFAFSAQRIEPLLRGLALMIDATFNESASSIEVIGFIPITTFVAPALADLLPTERLDLSDMLLGALDMNMLRSLDGLLAALNVELPFDLPPLTQFAAMGTMLTSNHPNLNYRVETARAPGVQRVYIRADRADVLNVLLQWLLGSGLIAEILPDDLVPFFMQGTAEEMVAAVAQLAAPIYYAAPPVVLHAPVNVAYNPFPSWWGREGEVGAEQDARFLVNHADRVLGHVWTVITGQPSLSAGINDLLVELLEPANLFVTLTDTVIDLLDELLDGDIADMMDALLPLIPLLVVSDGNPFDVEAILDAVLAFDATARAATINDLTDFVEAMGEFISPLMPILNVLLFGSNLGVPDTGLPATAGTGTRGIVTVYGYNGFENGLLHLYNLLASALGIPAFTAPAANASDAARINAILLPIVDIVNAILDAPVNSLLSLLPNLIFFIAAPAQSADPT
ncbi:MAG: hypothetical protein FWB76_04210, partial [Oscillospiraceae bacterium]|nr:hypothetical protein [Oscillospiraceae bacterium]